MASDEEQLAYENGVRVGRALAAERIEELEETERRLRTQVAYECSRNATLKTRLQALDTREDT